MVVEIVLTDKAKINKPTIITGFPSVGLVGSIATEFLTTNLKMKEIGFIKSRDLPPVAIVKNGIPMSAIRLYAYKNLVVFVSDTAVHPKMSHDIAKAIADFAKKTKAARVISLGGIAADEASKKVYAVAIDETTANRLEKKGYEKIKLGFLTGVFGVLMLECKEIGMESFGFLSASHSEVPDPGAAAVVLDALAKETGITVDTNQLEQTAGKIEKKLEELARQTKEVHKDVNYPSVYG